MTLFKGNKLVIKSTHRDETVAIGPRSNWKTYPDFVRIYAFSTILSPAALICSLRAIFCGSISS